MKNGSIYKFDSPFTSMIENVETYLRIRPPINEEMTNFEILSYSIQKEENIIKIDDNIISSEFKFSKIFDMDSSQDDIFKEIKKNLSLIFHGYNLSFVIFGEGESGKSYTLLGHDYAKQNCIRHPFQNYISEGENGLLPNFFKFIFSSGHSKNLVIYFSSALIYKEQIYDLLLCSNNKKNLKFKIGIGGQILINNLSEYYISNSNDAIKMLRRAYKSKMDIENSLNVPKGKTHFLFQMLIESRSVTDQNIYTISKVSFVELASFDKEFISQLNIDDPFCPVGEECFGYNTFFKVINELSTNRLIGKDIFYKSKLSTILSQYFYANSKTLFFCTIPPFSEHLKELLFSLKFSYLIQNITNSICSTQIHFNNEDFLLKMKTEMEAIKKCLTKLEEKSEKAKSIIEKNEFFKKNIERQENKPEIIINEIRLLRTNFQSQFKLPQHSRFYFLNDESIKNSKLNIKSNFSNIYNKKNENKNDIQFKLPRNLQNKSLMEEIDDYSNPIKKFNNHRRIRFNPLQTEKHIELNIISNLKRNKNSGRKNVLEILSRSSILKNLTNQGRCPICTLMIPCNHYKSIIDLSSESIKRREIKLKEVTNVSNINDNSIKRGLNQTSLFNANRSLTKGLEDKFSLDKSSKYNYKKNSKIQYSLCNDSLGRIRTRLNSKFKIESNSQVNKEINQINALKKNSFNSAKIHEIKKFKTKLDDNSEEIAYVQN